MRMTSRETLRCGIPWGEPLVRLGNALDLEHGDCPCDPRGKPCGVEYLGKPGTSWECPRLESWGLPLQLTLGNALRSGMPGGMPSVRLGNALDLKLERCPCEWLEGKP